MTSLKSFQLIKGHLPISLFLCALAFFRFGLMGQGIFFNPDEFRYLGSLSFLLDLKTSGFPTVLIHLFDSDARPGFILLGLMPAFIQWKLAPTGMAPLPGQGLWGTLHHPEFYSPVVVFNILISVLTALIFYLMSRKWLQDRLLAFGATVTWSLLSNTNLYIRHLVPYDWSLFFFFLALYVSIRHTSPSNKTILLCGGLSAFAVTVYPGFYMFYAINAVSVFVASKKNAKALGLFVLPLVVWMGILELASHWAGRSMILSSLTLSDTVIYGSPRESLIFLPKYLLCVEGPVGALILFLSVLFCCRTGEDSLKRNHIVWAALVCYLIHGMSGFVFHRPVFYGRVMHMYLPFIILGAFLVIKPLKNEKWQLFVIVATLAFSLISFAQFSSQYLKLHYPRDVVINVLDYMDRKDILFVQETQPLPAEKSGFQAVAVNVSDLFSIPEEHYPETFAQSMKLLSAWPHPMTFVAYGFEGLSIEERQRVRARNYQMKIYVK